MKQLFFAIMLFMTQTGWADSLDSLQHFLESSVQVQEKVYVHTDNTCYFIGDTIWYKAYVLRADSLMPTDMSKILYVELLSPDGVVAERQRIIISDKGFTNGQFVLKDSLYSGYYEIRAYTRWMLNFNVFERRYSRDDRYRFYNNQMAKDYFRDWDGLYSRVIPIYSKPEKEGDYDGKYMYARPKQEVSKPKKEELLVSFFPEGGGLLSGVSNTVAFEVTDQNGQAVDITGTLSDGTQIATSYMGRGKFTVKPSSSVKASFTWKNKNYSFSLPKLMRSGAVLSYDIENGKLLVTSSSDLNGQPMAVAVMCRGRLYSFIRGTFSSAGTQLSIDKRALPTGVNEIAVFNDSRNILASRLFFVNNHDVEEEVVISTGGSSDFRPYEKVELAVKSSCPTLFSIAVRDGHTDDATYDNGNMMTDMLLASDLKGFVANPAYYFSKDDARHRSDLDLLMMVQGWRRYRRQSRLRYLPERTMTVEGTVHKMIGLKILDIEDIDNLDAHKSVAEEMMEQAIASTGFTDSGSASESEESDEGLSIPEMDYSEFVEIDNSPIELGVNHGGLKHEVLVEAEIQCAGDVAGAVQRTNNHGHFVFEIPPYYGYGVLFMKAYNEKDSLKKSMEHGNQKGFLNEETYADYYVKQDLFYPVFAHPYSYYQNHVPPVDFTSYVEEDTTYTMEMSRLDGDHTLSTVDVTARRRGRRAIDYSKPAFVVDAYDLYNEATDRGLSWGLVNMGTFPYIACFTVYGNLDRRNDYNVEAKIDNYTFYKNFSSVQSNIKNRSAAAIFKNLHLNRIQNFRFYTDYEPRNVDSLLSQSLNRADITVVYETIPDDGKRVTYRDRRYILPGFAEPEDYYHPDYSMRKPEDPVDYRRTLYWNPNAVADETGRFNATFFNNGHETRVKVSVAGVTPDGRIITGKY